MGDRRYGDTLAQLGDERAPGWEVTLPGSKPHADTLDAALMLLWLRGEGTEGAGTLERTPELRDGGPRE